MTSQGKALGIHTPNIDGTSKAGLSCKSWDVREGGTAKTQSWVAGSCRIQQMVGVLKKGGMQAPRLAVIGKM